MAPALAFRIIFWNYSTNVAGKAKISPTLFVNSVFYDLGIPVIGLKTSIETLNFFLP